MYSLSVSHSVKLVLSYYEKLVQKQIFLTEKMQNSQNTLKLTFNIYFLILFSCFSRFLDQKQLWSFETDFYTLCSNQLRLNHQNFTEKFKLYEVIIENIWSYKRDVSQKLCNKSFIVALLTQLNFCKNVGRKKSKKELFFKIFNPSSHI